MEQINLNHELDQKTVNVIRGLIMDGTRKANSGHPGGAMSSTDMAYILFKYFLKFNPDDSKWINRDRFVLSAGHETMLLYSLLYLQGFLPMEELKRFRRLGSLTPGHPEYGLTPGVDATTGPLGQGVATSVGMALAETVLAAQLGKDTIDHYTYVLAGDGDLQEPVALGAAANAGHFKLGKLILFYDKNNAQISGPVSRADSTDIAKVFEGFGWQVIKIDGHNHWQIAQAVIDARQNRQQPSIIIGETIMAKNAANVEGDFHTHGSPLSEEEIAATKKKTGLPSDEFFYVPQEVVKHFRSGFDGLREIVSKWKQITEKRSSNDEAFAGRLKEAETGKLKFNLDIPVFDANESLATRVAFGKTLALFAKNNPSLIGGSADLEPSNNTKLYAGEAKEYTPANRAGRNISFAVREFPMAAILNGIALHGGFKPFGTTFLVFSDYAKPAIRLSALQKLPVLYPFTHDSFYVGEDGPTHQPVEQLATFRSMPGVVVFRPADARETAFAMKLAFEIDDKPVILALTRQSLPVLDIPQNNLDNVKKGAYIVKDAAGTPDVILIATGSEVHLALKVAGKLTDMNVRVVNMTSMELFDGQPVEYKNEILPPQVTYRVSIEAASTFGWGKYVAAGWSFGLDRFGESGPAKELEKEFGFEPGNIAELIRERKP
jgi:transketolase